MAIKLEQFEGVYGGGIISTGLDSLISDFEALAALPEAVLDEMNNVQAEIVAKYQKAEAAKLNKQYYPQSRYTGGGYDFDESPIDRHTGQTAAAVSVKSSRYYPKSQTRKAWVTFRGRRQDGKAASEVAFLNEFGSKSINARGFVRLANERASAEALAAAERVYDRYLKEKGL